MARRRGKLSRLSRPKILHRGGDIFTALGPLGAAAKFVDKQIQKNRPKLERAIRKIPFQSTLKPVKKKRKTAFRVPAGAKVVESIQGIKDFNPRYRFRKRR